MDSKGIVRMIGASMALGAWSGRSFLPNRAEAPKRERKCLRPGCEKMTTHNGGYCSGDCCRQHKEEKRREKEAAERATILRA